MENFNLKTFLSEGKLLKESININGSIPIPTKQWKEYYREYVNEIKGSIDFIEEKDKEKAISTINYMKQGIQNPPRTLDAALEWWRGLKNVANGGFGLGNTGEDPIGDALTIYINDESNELGEEKLEAIENYITSNF